MLDQLRRHAGSWLVKTVLSLIVMSFALFFGYTEIADKSQDIQNYIALVGKEAIPRRRYEVNLQESLEQLRDGLQGEVPENMETFLKQNVLEQLIGRALIVQYAHHLGLTVSDEEIAEAIRSDRALFTDGVFDTRTYEEKFLPYFRQRNGEDFEEVMERQLLVEKMQTLIPVLFGPWQEELDASLREIHAELESISGAALFEPWLEEFKENTKIEVY